MVRGGAGGYAKRNLAWAGIALLVVVLSSGCVAGTRGGPVQGRHANAAGLRYYLPALYLVVQQTPEGVLSTSFEVMADSSQEYYVEPFVILAKQTVTFKPKDGMLQSFKLEQDSTAVSTALVSALKDIEVKRFEIDKAKREAEAAAAAASARPARSERDGNAGRQSSIWVFQISGRQATRVAAIPSMVGVPPKPAEAATTPTPDPKFGVDKDADNRRYVVSFKGHEFTQADITAKRVTFTNVKSDTVTILEKGKLGIPSDAIEGDGAVVEYEGQRTDHPMKKF